MLQQEKFENWLYFELCDIPMFWHVEKLHRLVVECNGIHRALCRKSPATAACKHVHLSEVIY